MMHRISLSIRLQCIVNLSADIMHAHCASGREIYRIYRWVSARLLYLQWRYCRLTLSHICEERLKKANTYRAYTWVKMLYQHWKPNVVKLVKDSRGTKLTLYVQQLAYANNNLHRSHQRSALQAFERRFHRWLLDSPHKRSCGPFPWHDVIMYTLDSHHHQAAVTRLQSCLCPQ